MRIPDSDLEILQMRFITPEGSTTVFFQLKDNARTWWVGKHFDDNIDKLSFDPFDNPQDWPEVEPPR